MVFKDSGSVRECFLWRKALVVILLVLWAVAGAIGWLVTGSVSWMLSLLLPVPVA